MSEDSEDREDREIYLSRTQVKRFRCLTFERRAISEILDMALESITCRKIEVIRLHDELWDEITEQHDLDRSLGWEADPCDRIIKRKYKKGNTRGFTLDNMDDEKMRKHKKED